MLKTRSGTLSLADLVQLMLFACMNFSYSLYMAEYLAQSVYLALLFAVVGFAAIRIFFLLVRRRRGGNLYFGRSALVISGVATVFAIVTMFRETAALDRVTTISLNEALYIVGPAVIAVAVANTTSWRVADAYMLILLARYALYFVLSFDLDLQSLLQINWLNSGSSSFESSFAHDLLIVECYFIFRTQTAKASVALVLTMISFKRASFILAPILLLFRNSIRRARPPRRITLFIMWLLGTSSPFMIMLLYSDQFGDFFETAFGVDVNSFFTGRETIYDIATGDLPQNLGFGWLNTLLSEVTFGAFGTVWNGLLHNDTLRIFLEVSVFGLAAYIFALVRMAKWSRLSLILVGYTMFVLVTSRLLTQMSFWIVLFLVLALLERDARSSESQNGPLERNSRVL